MYTCNAWQAETASGLKKIEKPHSDKMQTTKCSHKPALGEVAPLSNHFKPGLTLKLTGNPGPTRMAPAISKKVNQLLGLGSTTPARATLTWLNQTALV